LTYTVNLDRRWYPKNYEIISWLENNFPGAETTRGYRVSQAFGHMWIEFDQLDDMVLFQLNWL